MKLRVKKLSLLSNATKMIFATMFWAELSFFCKPFTCLPKKKNVHFIYRLFIAIAMTTGKNTKIFYNSIRSEHFSACIVFFPTPMFHVIFKMSNSFDMPECTKNRKKNFIWKSFFPSILHSATNDRIVEQ